MEISENAEVTNSCTFSLVPLKHAQKTVKGPKKSETPTHPVISVFHFQGWTQIFLYDFEALKTEVFENALV